MKTLFFLFLFLPQLLFCVNGKVQERLEERVKTFQQEHLITGIAASVIGREDLQKFQQMITFGDLSIKSPIPINSYSEFRIGPLTQLFTAAILAYLVQEGQVSLNDPVVKFLPRSQEIPTYNGKNITLGDLATHSSGLPDMPYSLKNRSSFSVGQMYRFLSKYELSREPGTEYEYSNFGYAFLANLLSRITKRSFPDLCEQIVTKPLNLKDTGFSFSTDQKKRVVTGYEGGKGISPLVSEKVYSVFIGSGGLYSTVKDMMTFLSFNMGKERTSLNTILSIMQTPYHSFKQFQAGIGWKIKPLNNGKLYHLSGTLFGFGVYMGMIPEKDVGVVILTNQGEVNPDLLGEEMIEILNP